jgi:anti-anti-sigma factor
MDNPLIYLGALFAVLLLVAFIAVVARRGTRPTDLVARSGLMSLEEHYFFDLLSEAEKEQHYVFPKVALAQLVEARDGGRVRWHNDLATMAVDFAILDPHDLRIIGVVDVQEDEEKQSKESAKAGEQMDSVIEGLGIPVLRIRANEKHTVDSLRRLIRETFPRRLTPSAVRVGMDGDAVCIRLDGNAMFTSSTTFRELTREMNRRGHRQFRLDLGACNIMDSTFIGTLMAFGLQLRQQGGGLSIVRASPECRDQLQQYGLGQVIKISQGNGAVFTPEGEWIASSPRATPADHRETIIQAHEALVASSAENRLRFHDALEFLKGNVPEGH